MEIAQSDWGIFAKYCGGFLGECLGAPRKAMGGILANLWGHGWANCLGESLGKSCKAVQGYRLIPGSVLGRLHGGVLGEVLREIVQSLWGFWFEGSPEAPGLPPRSPQARGPAAELLQSSGFGPKAPQRSGPGSKGCPG